MIIYTMSNYVDLCNAIITVVIIILIIVCVYLVFVTMYCQQILNINEIENFTNQEESREISNINGQSSIIMMNCTGSVKNISTPLSMTLQLPNCNAPNIGIDNLILPKDAYMIIDTSDLGTRISTTIYLPSNFNTFTLTDQSGNTSFTISQSTNSKNIIKEVNWDNNKLKVICEYEPMSQGMIRIIWPYSTFTILSAQSNFKYMWQ